MDRAYSQHATIGDGDSFTVDRVEIGYDATPHRFHIDNHSAAQHHWERVVADNPALFDGTVMLHSSMDRRPGLLSTLAHPVPFSTFLYWRSLPDVEATWHLFGAPLIVSSDNRVLLIRMAASTANAGRIYSPSGSLDPADKRGDRLDIDGNMHREVHEETGLDLAAARADATYRILVFGMIVVVVKRYVFDRSAADLIDAVRAHIAASDTPEIDAVLAVDAATPPMAGYQFFTQPMLDWHFKGR